MQKGIERNEHIKEKKDCREMSGKGVRVGTKKKKTKSSRRDRQKKKCNARKPHRTVASSHPSNHTNAPHIFFFFLFFSSPLLFFFPLCFFSSLRGEEFFFFHPFDHHDVCSLLTSLNIAHKQNKTKQSYELHPPLLLVSCANYRTHRIMAVFSKQNPSYSQFVSTSNGLPISTASFVASAI